MTDGARGEGIFGKKKKGRGQLGRLGPKGGEGARGWAARTAHDGGEEGGWLGRLGQGEGGGWAKRGEGGREKEKRLFFF
jgi:hypothetical protein